MEASLIVAAMTLALERTGFVLVHPGAKALRIAWSNDFGH
jgi:hypothetical protein